MKDFFTKERIISIVDRLTKFLMDFMLTSIFSFYLIFSVCSIIPQIQTDYDYMLLLEYSLFFSLVWNILLYNGIIAVITLLGVFSGSVITMVYYLLKPEFKAWIDSYFRWISTLFLEHNRQNTEYEYITVILIVTIASLLMTFFSAKYMNILTVAFFLFPFAIYFDIAGSGHGDRFFAILLFALLVYYMRSRQFIYLDFRNSEIDSIPGSTAPTLTMYPVLIIALLAFVFVGSLPYGKYLYSETDTKISESISEFVSRVETNLYNTQRAVVYEDERLGSARDENEGIILNSDVIKVLSVTSHSPDIEYFYLRSYSYKDYDNGWALEKFAESSPESDTSYYFDETTELTSALSLLRHRGLFGADASIRDKARALNKLLSDAELEIEYENISTNSVFEVSLSHDYSILLSTKRTILSDRNGSGLYSPSKLESGVTYIADAVSVAKNSSSIEFYRYFGDNYYDNLTDREIRLIYSNLINEFSYYANRIQHLYTENTGISPSIVSLGKSLVKSGSSEYDKALAIADYLLKNYKFNSKVCVSDNETDGADKSDDFVSDFLFDTKEGCSVHFASAAVLLCRAAGIPARYAEGYLTYAGGDLDTVSVHQKDAHAWAEVYLEGLGWVTLETTPGKGLPATDILSENYDEIDEEPPIWERVSLGSIKSFLLGIVKTSLVIVVVIVSIGLLYMLVVFAIFITRLLLLRTKQGYERFEGTLKFLFRGASGAGYKRGKGEGLLEYCARLDALLPDEYALSPSVSAAYSVIYGSGSLTNGDYTRLDYILANYGDYLSCLGVGFRKKLLGRFIKGSL